MPNSLRQVSVLAGGTIAAQGLIVASTPVLTRLFEPKQVGQWALYLAVVYTFSALAGIRYDGAVVAARDDHAAALIAKGAAAIAITTTTGATVIVVVLLAVQRISIPIGILLVVAAINGLTLFGYNVRCAKLNRNERYTEISRSRLSMAFVQCAIQISGGLVSAHVGILIAGTFVGHLAGILVCHLGHEAPDSENAVSRRSDIYSQLRQHWRMPVFNGLNTIADLARTNGLNLGIAIVYTTYQLGQFSLSWRIMLLPTSLIGAAVAAVYYRRFAAADPSSLVNEVKSCLTLTVTTACIPFGLLALMGEPLFRLTFGKGWAEAGAIAQGLAPLGFVMFVSSALSPIFIVTRKQWQSAVMGVVLLVPIMLLMSPQGRDIVAFSTAYSASTSAILIVYCAMAALAARSASKNPKRNL